MANNWFSLTLDTTAPQMEIHSPQYIINGHYFEFRVSANELIDRFEAKAVDNGLNEYPLIMQRDDQSFIGLIDTFGFTNGLAKIVVTLYDDVHNSKTTEKVFNVLSSINEMNLNVKKYENQISSKNRTIKLMYKYDSNSIAIKKMSGRVFILRRKNNIKVGEEI